MPSCTNPSYALDLGLKENGTRNIKFLPRRLDLYSYEVLTDRYGSDNLLPLPCGKCLSCKLNKARDWAVRSVCEAMYHEHNYFITFTYDDAHLPVNGLLEPDMITKFLKLLRYYFGEYRYLLVGEYGSKQKRPHYHMLAFGLNLEPHLKLVHERMVCKKLEEIWQRGFVYIDEVNYNTANYVARYTTKKIFGDWSDEFLKVSTRPGLGYKFVEDHKESLSKYLSVYGPFGVSKLPRYFEVIGEALDPEFLKIKKEKIDKSSTVNFHELLVHGMDHYDKLYAYRSEVAINKFKQSLKRSDL